MRPGTTLIYSPTAPLSPFRFLPHRSKLDPLNTSADQTLGTMKTLAPASGFDIGLSPGNDGVPVDPQQDAAQSGYEDP